MNALWSIAVNGFRESLRNRVTVVVAGFALVMIFTSTMAMDFTVITYSRVIVDVGLGVMSLIAAFLAVFLSTGQLPRDIERRTIYMVASRPISRTAYMVGRYAGNLLVMYFVLTVMAGLFFVQMLMFKETITQAVIAALVGLACEVALLSAIGSAFASMSSPLVSATATIGLYFVGHLLPDLQKLSERSSFWFVKAFGRASVYFIPDFDRLDLKLRATYAHPTPWPDLFQSMGYTVAYAAIVLAIGCALFERRDFR